MWQIWHLCRSRSEKGIGPMAEISLRSCCVSMCIHILIGGLDLVLDEVKEQFGMGQVCVWSEGFLCGVVLLFVDVFFFDNVLVFFGFDKDFLWVEEEDGLIFRDLFFGGMVLCWLSFLFPAFDECLKVRERESFRKKKVLQRYLFVQRAIVQ